MNRMLSIEMQGNVIERERERERERRGHQEAQTVTILFNQELQYKHGTINILG